MSEVFVQSFEHLKGRPKDERALPLLQKIASLVKPIMRKHSWKLPVLAEFFPESPNLLGLNINHGQKILIRLRPAHAPDTFLPEDDILHTMLHELTHNVHGPHDEKFYKFLTDLEEEYDALKRSGYAGEGFHSKGKRLGTGLSHDLPPHLARQRALEAAEKRRKVSSVLSGGGKLGGGSLARSGLSPRQLAALAAERRARDAKACGSGALAEQEAQKASKESVKHDAIDLTEDSDSDDVIFVDDFTPIPGSSQVAIPQSEKVASAPALAQSRNSQTSSPRARSSPTAQRPATFRSMPPARTSPTEKIWSCSVCTLINEPLAFQCEACMTPRAQPQEPSLGWMCGVCGEQGIDHQFWTCNFCGSVKTESVVG
ncbi:hypothetical protein EW146_g814 [Bondarzewia mesenterica]|uniref:WLM domain-containing protein n=1 Tax=Bondarzewia mesenterica TaxID=1095465 RepID=A0A4S4MC45_9AGAM|nr:hypothetical protein EW146_g814 [Bondarzewia mesenterica]